MRLSLHFGMEGYRAMNTLKHIWSNLWFNLKSRLYDIKWGVINIWTYRDTLLHSRPWDYSMLFMAMKDSLEAMEHTHRHHGNLVNNGKYAQQMRITRLAIDRILKDEYILNATDLIEKEGAFMGFELESKNILLNKNHALLVADGQKKQDVEFVARMLTKHSLSWWD